MPESSNHLKTPEPDAAFVERVVRYLDGTLDDDGVARLNRELAADPQRRRRFVRLCLVESLATEELAAQAEPSLDQIVPENEAESLPIINAPTARFTTPQRQPARHSHFSRWTTAAGLLLAIGVLTMFRDQWWPQPLVAAVVAHVSHEVAAQWDGAGPAAGLMNGQSWTLKQGCVEITFIGSAKAILEGPARFMLDSGTAMTLSSGKLAASVSGGRFIVHTPQATFTDLGTEFGINAEQDGSSRLEVFKGKVRAEQNGTHSSKATITRLLTEGQAADVTKAAISLDPQGAMPQRFIRSLANTSGPLDVVDLVSGGDGTTHRRGIAIDVTSGHAGALPPVKALAGDHQYHLVSALPVVDGCFIPDGSARIDSAGHTFTFPATSNQSYNHLWAGGGIPWPEENSYPVSILDGVDYAQAGHGLLFMHSNKGVTLDLAAVRRLHPGHTFTHWTGTVGNTFRPVPGKSPPRADFFLLVDGQLRFEKSGFTNEASFPVVVPVNDNDRFLTLVVTDGGDGHNRDWVLIGDPMLSSEQVPSGVK